MIMISTVAAIPEKLQRAMTLHKAWRLEEAQSVYEEILILQPTNFDALHLLGTVFAQSTSPQRGAELIRKAIDSDPANAAVFAAHTNLGSALCQLKQFNPAIECYNRAIAIRPDYGPAYHNRAFARLALGDMDNGWVDLEWRWRNKPNYASVKQVFEQRRWTGAASIAGKTILLHCEQGLGDTLQFCRYAQLVSVACARVVLVVQKPLLSLLSTLHGPAEVRAANDGLPEFDYFCPLMSLPLAFKTTLYSVPAFFPYVQSDRLKRRFWEEKLGRRERPRVGLVWSGGFRPDRRDLWSVNQRRNIPLQSFAPLFRPDIEFYSLQKGQPAESELADLMSKGWEGQKIIDHTNLLSDFSDTAALIEQLDLVISADTSTAHLAGALGKPVWILNRFDACWRWLTNRNDSPWYKTARLYRQETAGDWEGVVRRVKTDLAQHFAAQAQR